MKAKILFTIIILIVGANIGNANPIDSSSAKIVARCFYNRISQIQTQNFVLSYTGKSADSTSCYFIFNVNLNDGFVIVSADDAALPILGYSPTGHYDVNNLSPEFVFWMNDYEEQIFSIKANNLQPTIEIQEEWQEYKNNQANRIQSPPSIQSVGPLLSTTWNQSPYYNALCPNGSVTGCTATAMAQIMKYWNYPAHGYGATPAYTTTTNSYSIPSVNLSSTIYNWASMPSNLTSSNNDVATLMYDCGVSVKMDYGPSSGAWVLTNDWAGNHPFSAQNAYTTYFGYNSSTIQGVQQSNYTTSSWISLIENEINSGRPVQYAGWEVGPANGHTWVCDGYDASNYLHMNWGWGGSSNGYFAVGALNPSYQFNTNDEALLGIQPSFSSSTDLITNGDFSNLYTGWTTSGMWYISNSFSCYNSASAYAYLGDASGNAVNNAFGNLSQDVTIPANASSATLSYSVSINTNETSTSTTFDYIAVYFTDLSWNPLTSTTAYTYGNLQGAAGAGGCQTYQSHSFSVPSSLFGQTVKVVVHGYTDGSNLTKLRVDDISLTYVCSSPGVATVNGNNSGCAGTPITFTASASNATSYNWTAPGGWSPTSGSGSSFTSTPGSSGNVTATPSNSCGSGSPGSMFVNVNPAPGVATVSGNNSGCTGTPITFTASASNATSYNWTAPGGWSPTSGSGSSFTSTPGGSGNVTATPSNSCGSGSPGSMFVNVNPAPGVATVSGNNSGCAGTPITFTASASNATSYNWTAPGGWSPTSGSGSSFTSTPGSSGNVTATPSNSCGSGSPGSMFVNINPAPGAATVSSNTSGCVGTPIIFTASASNATSYNWTAPGGWSPTSGSGSSFTSTPGGSGSITVTPSNGCGSGSPGSVSVTINTLSLSASTTTPCVDDGNVSLTGTPANGTWSGPGVTGNNFNPGMAGVGSQILTYSYTDPSGCSISSTLTMTVNACVGIVEQTSGNDISILPNPTSGKFTLSSKITTGEISIYNMLGEKVFSSTIQRLHDATIDLSDKPNGIYFITVKTETGSSTQKIIINH